jgi:dihydroorotase
MEGFIFSSSKLALPLPMYSGFYILYFSKYKRHKIHMGRIVLKNGRVANRGKFIESDILIEGRFIKRVDRDISADHAEIIDAAGQWILPGIIDDQVHFREPGLTHKGDIFTESRAAVAGGVTSYMEMPNTRPPAVTRELLEEKYSLASRQIPGQFQFLHGNHQRQR